MTSAARYVLLSFMFWTAAGFSTPLSKWFGTIIDGLCQVVAIRAAREPSLVPVLTVLWGRLRRAIVRFDRLAARVRDGKHLAASTAPLRPRRASRAARPAPPHPLPRGYAWLSGMMGEHRHHVAGCGGALAHMLQDPEVIALLEAEPKLKRLLRPLFPMLAAPLPAILALPPRVRRPRAPAAPPPQASHEPSPEPLPGSSRRRRRLPPLDTTTHAERLGVPLSPHLASLPSSISIPGLPKRRATRA